MTTNNNAVTKSEELVITRVFDAPRELVWKAWTDPTQVMRWWGPQYFTSPVCKIDLRVGGKYLFSMRSPDGQEFYSTGVYKEITPVDRLAYTDSFSDANGNILSPALYGMGDDFPIEQLVTVVFEDQQGKTRMTLKNSHLPEGEMREMTISGWNTSLDKLAESLR